MTHIRSFSADSVAGHDDPPDGNRFLSRDDCVRMSHRVFDYATGGGLTIFSVQSNWTGELRWARNRTMFAGDRRNNEIVIGRNVRGALSSIQTNQTDDTSLRNAVRRSDELTHFADEIQRTSVEDPLIDHPYPKTTIWSDATYQQPAAARGALARTLVASAEKAGMFSAGYMNVAARGTAYISSAGRVLYAPQTFAQCSMSIRDPQGIGSGWAGASSYDWERIDPDKLAAIALDKCLRSRNPVLLEPGRYTTILEPQAVYDLFKYVLEQNGRPLPEDNNAGPFAAPPRTVNYGGISKLLGMSKLGARILDERITVSHDPADPELGVVPFAGIGEPFRKVTWIEKGVLVKLSYAGEDYAVPKLAEQEGYLNSGAFRMSGGTTSMDEMIATTERGLIVTRFSGLDYLDRNSLLMSGLTRDGLWLVEHGKITRPVKNFWITESPLFAFNNVEQLGVPVPVFSPEKPAIVPPIKVRDFSFTSIADAV